jgi:hypothetical protein
MDGEFLDVENQTGEGGLAHWKYSTSKRKPSARRLNWLCSINLGNNARRFARMMAIYCVSLGQGKKS